MIRRVSRNGRALVVRPLRLTDVDRLCAFMAGLSPESRRLFRPHAFTREDAQRAVREAQGARSSRFVLVEPREEGIVGYAYFSESNATDARVPVVGIAIADRYQNMGLGRFLLELLFEEAQAQGKVGLELTVYKENERAIHLYESLGFRIIGEADSGTQYAMRVEFAIEATATEQRGVFIDPVPWNLAALTADTWSSPEWKEYVDFLCAAGANTLLISLWPSQYYHPDEPDTVRNAWRCGVLREVLGYARALGMETLLGFAFTGVPPCVWFRYPDLRAAEVEYQGAALCWTRGREIIERFPAFLFDALADCTAGFVLQTSGPAFCGCPNCRDYGRVVSDAWERYQSLLGTRSALRVSLLGAAEVASRLGPARWDTVFAALALEAPALVDAGDMPTQDRLAERGVPFLVCEADLASAGASECETLLPKPRLRQVERLVAQNHKAVGVLGKRLAPRTQFVTDYLLIRKLLFPTKANHEILRDLGGYFFGRPSHVFDFARAVWALDAWWETGRRRDLEDARDGLAELPPDPGGWVRALQHGTEVLCDLVRYLEGSERHFDALVARAHARLAESPAFAGYTVARVWQARARKALADRLSECLDLVRNHLGQLA